MKAILIAPNKEPIVVDKEWTYEEMREFIGGPLESIPHGLPNVTLFGHDEAKFAGKDGRPLPFNAIASMICSPRLRRGDWVSGNVLVIGFNPNNGESVEIEDWVEPLVETVKRTALKEGLLDLIP